MQSSLFYWNLCHYLCLAWSETEGAGLSAVRLSTLCLTLHTSVKHRVLFTPCILTQFNLIYTNTGQNGAVSYTGCCCDNSERVHNLWHCIFDTGEFTVYILFLLFSRDDEFNLFSQHLELFISLCRNDKCYPKILDSFLFSWDLKLIIELSSLSWDLKKMIPLFQDKWQ